LKRRKKERKEEKRNEGRKMEETRMNEKKMGGGNGKFFKMNGTICISVIFLQKC